MSSSAQPLVARYSRLKLLGWVAGSGLMAALSALVATMRLGALSFLMSAAGTFGLLFFGTICLVFLFRLFDRREQVVIDARGVYVRAHGSSWIALRSIDTMKSDMGRLSLYLFKPSKYPIERWHRKLAYRVNGSNARSFYGDAWIWSSYLDKSLTAFVDAISSHRPMTERNRQTEATIAGWEERGVSDGRPAAD